jgi:predicted transcriptional regulator
MGRSLDLAKRYLKDATRRKKKGSGREIKAQFRDLRKAVRHILSHLEKSEKQKRTNAGADL